MSDEQCSVRFNAPVSAAVQDAGGLARTTGLWKRKLALRTSLARHVRAPLLRCCAMLRRGPGAPVHGFAYLALIHAAHLRPSAAAVLPAISCRAALPSPPPCRLARGHWTSSPWAGRSPAEQAARRDGHGRVLLALGAPLCVPQAPAVAAPRL
jgi:hypothetical protein